MDSVYLIIRQFKNGNKFFDHKPYRKYIFKIRPDINTYQLANFLKSEESFEITDSYYSLKYIEDVYQMGAGGGSAYIILDIFRSITENLIVEFVMGVIKKLCGRLSSKNKRKIHQKNVNITQINNINILIINDHHIYNEYHIINLEDLEQIQYFKFKPTPNDKKKLRKLINKKELYED